MMNVSTIRELLRQKLRDNDIVDGREGTRTIEILGCSFLADEPYIFREPNQDYIQAELDWYESGITNVKPFTELYGKVPDAWERSADDNGNVNSNYGHLIFHPLYHKQYDNVLEELKKNPGSRRGTMVYIRPSIHVEYNMHGRNDFICTLGTCHFIRDNELTTCVHMRSNDAVFGYNNDYAWFNEVHTHLAHDLGVGRGPLYWNAASLHVYEAHWRFVNEDNTSLE